VEDVWQGPQRLRIPGGGRVLRGERNAASVNYRYSHEARFPAQIHGAKAAIRWLRANANYLGIDLNRIGVWGISAGGHLAALLGTTGDNPTLEGHVGISGFPSNVQAVVTICAPTNLFDPNWTVVQDPVREASRELLGGTAAEYPELARLASPALQVTSTAAPVLIVHGAKDAHVPLSQAQQLCDAFQRAGVQNRIRTDRAGRSLHQCYPCAITAAFNAGIVPNPPP